MLNTFFSSEIVPFMR